MGASVAVRADVPRGILRLRPDNLVERPWGGVSLFDFKRLGQPPPGKRYGESFEVAADPGDPETAARPSVVVMPDGSEVSLVDLLRAAPEAILGGKHATAWGPRIPLLPKFLDVREMLSVQTHPPGHPEAYVIIRAEPGATIRLGFRRDVDLGDLGAQHLAGRLALEGLLALVPDTAQLQTRLRPWLATPGASAAALARDIAPRRASKVESLLRKLARGHRLALDALNEIPVAPGQVVLNATSDGSSADVHALGNPEGRGILLFEIRRTGPTFRMWDHARIPPRPLHIERALATIDGRRRDPASFFAVPEPIGPGILRSVECRAFAAVHLRLHRGARVSRPSSRGVRSLHVLSGAIVVDPGSTTLGRGESALVPVALGGYDAAAIEDDSEVVEVSMPIP
jgi:mannose-6-phosphate isomerase class I